MDSFFLEHAGAIYLTEVACIFTVAKAEAYLTRKERKHQLTDRLMFLNCIPIGVYGGLGFVRLYFQDWPTTTPTLSLYWINAEVLPFFAAMMIAVYALYTLLIWTKVKKLPDSQK